MYKDNTTLYTGYFIAYRGGRYYAGKTGEDVTAALTRITAREREDYTAYIYKGSALVAGEQLIHGDLYFNGLL